MARGAASLAGLLGLAALLGLSACSSGSATPACPNTSAVSSSAGTSFTSAASKGLGGGALQCTYKSATSNLLIVIEPGGAATYASGLAQLKSTATGLDATVEALHGDGQQASLMRLQAQFGQNALSYLVQHSRHVVLVNLVAKKPTLAEMQRLGTLAATS
jgi:hypothetical protein